VRTESFPALKVPSQRQLVPLVIVRWRECRALEIEEGERLGDWRSYEQRKGAEQVLAPLIFISTLTLGGLNWGDIFMLNYKECML
jgi:hypothetical protein